MIEGITYRISHHQSLQNFSSKIWEGCSCIIVPFFPCGRSYISVMVFPFNMVTPLFLAFKIWTGTSIPIGMKTARANESALRTFFFSHPLSISCLLLLLFPPPWPPSSYLVEIAITLQGQHEPCNNLFSTLSWWENIRNSILNWNCMLLLLLDSLYVLFLMVRLSKMS